MALLPVEDARAKVLEGAGPTGTEQTGLLQLNRRVLAEDVAALLTQPPFDCSAMDGYAVAGGVRQDSRLELIGEAAAGHAFAGTVGPGQCVRISTGAPVPDGADAILIQENATRDGGVITVGEAVPAGQHVRKRGFDFAQGNPILKAGRVLDDRAIALAAASGHATLPVCKKPTVAILATGDELVEPGNALGAGQIISSNTYGLAAMCETAGADARILGIAKDTEQDLGDKISQSDGADILVTIGGASVGDHDLVGPVLKTKGGQLDFWKIAMRPGKPMMFGRRGSQRVLGLPGNPVSCLVTARIFLVPLICRLAGAAEANNGPMQAVAATELASNGPRQHYMRARLQKRGAELPLVTPLASQDSAALSLLSQAGCLIIRPPSDGPVAAGQTVPILLLGE